MNDVAKISGSIEIGSSFAPFLKWAGGKRWFADRYIHLVPERFERYIEPFLGSGAMLFALRPEKAVVSDLNKELVDCYRAICESPEKIEKILKCHHENHSEKYYYKTRSEKPVHLIESAAWLIYLNRTCWNGLYRVNKKNVFNVPLGTKKSVILSSDNFRDVGNYLRKIKIKNQDFEITINDAKEGDFIFVDPPYTVKHNMNGFVKYNDKIFSWDDQVRLRDAVERASDRGALVLVTNANHDSVRSLYRGLGEFRIINRASVLAANSIHRVRTEELVIRSWIKQGHSTESDGAPV